MERVLITGGRGFIGRYVVENLEGRGIEPVVFDRNRSSTFRNVILGDVRDPVAISEAVALVDGVIHLAGVLGTQETITDPRPAVETNIYGSLNVFSACHRYKKPCSYITVGNFWMNNPYSITKTTAERFAWMFNRELGTRISVVRALNAYGPRQKAAPVRKVIPNFILPALKDEEISVYGDGGQIMDMIYVTDVADIMVRSLLVDHGQFSYDPVRLGDTLLKFEAGTGRHTSISEIAELVIKLVGKGRIKYLPMRPGEPPRSVVVGDPMTLTPLYDGHAPELLPLEEGLRRTISYYDSVGADLKEAVGAIL